MKLSELIERLQEIRLTYARDMEVTVAGKNRELEAPIVNATHFTAGVRIERVILKLDERFDLEPPLKKMSEV